MLHIGVFWTLHGFNIGLPVYNVIQPYLSLSVSLSKSKEFLDKIGREKNQTLNDTTRNIFTCVSVTHAFNKAEIWGAEH